MRLSQKTLIAVGLTIVAMIAVLSFVWRGILLSSYEGFEHLDTVSNVERAVNALMDDVETVQQTQSGWSAWDPSYRFMAGQEPNYVNDNFSGTVTLTDLDVDMMIYPQSDGRLAFSRIVDATAKPARELPLPKSLLPYLKAGAPLNNMKSNEDKATGFITLPEGVLMVVSQPIIKTDHSGTPRGAIIWASYMTEKRIAKLAQITHLAMKARPVAAPDLTPTMKIALARLTAPGAPEAFVQPLDDKSVAGYAVVKDLVGKPALLLEVVTPRGIYNQGLDTVKQSIWLLILAGLLFGLLNMAMLKKIVLQRLARLNGEVARIGSSGNMSTRVEVQGKDELSRLAGSVNAMLGKLESSQSAILELEAWRKSEQRYTGLMDVSPSAVLIVANGRVAYANQVWARTLGYDEAAAVIGLDWLTLATPADRERLAGEAQRLLSHEVEILRMETKFERADGKTVDVEMAMNLMTFRDQLAIQVNAQDVTETNKAQDQLARMGKEMEIATRISTALVPTETPVTDFDLTMDLISAAEVGGDLIDYMPQPDGHFWLVIGDVTGHGLTPGLVMMMAQSMLTGYILDQPEASPSGHLIQLNQALYQNVKHRLGNDNYMTLQLIRHEGDGRFVAAGMHCDILIYRHETQTVDRIEVPGFWTGLMPDVKDMTSDYRFEMGPNDVMMLYSDGLIEAMNATDEQYDMERLEQALARYAHLPVEEIKARTLAEVNSWLIEQLDDISIIVLKRHAVGVAAVHDEAVAVG